MKHRTLKNLATFFLVLVLTICTVGALSMATQAKTETAAQRYVQEVKGEQQPEVEAFSAPTPEQQKASPLASIGAFLLILSIPTGALFLFLRAKRCKSEKTGQNGRRYSPRADMAFQNSLSVKSRV